MRLNTRAAVLVGALGVLGPLAFGVPAPACEWPSGQLSLFDGVLDGHTPVRLALVVHGRRVEGAYTTFPAYDRQVPVAGDLAENDGVRLEAYDASRWEGAWTASRGGSACDGLAGVFHARPGAPALAFQLTSLGGGAPTLAGRYAAAGVPEAAAAAIDRRAFAFWKAVLRGDRALVAGAIAYPMAIHTGRVTNTYRRPKDVIAHYDTIFTPAFVRRVEATIPALMWANAQGVMLGSGEAWFDEQGRVKALNP